MTDSNRLIVFVRLPEKGKVKTRLARTMGDETTLALYRCFVLDTLAAARRTACPTGVFFYPPDLQDVPLDWLGDGLTFLPQEGEDLGERMFIALQKTLLDCPRAVLIGSDCPDLPPAVIREAFESLKTHDAVLGPAADGGYYLMGFSSTAIIPAPFKGIRWGGPDVFDATVAVLKENGVSVHVLPLWRDIDEYGDLKAFFHVHKDDPRGRLLTVDFLRDHLHW
ncbi:MAG: 2-phospho-L-lactate guanylyltransferase [Syntrophorhabdus sp. PtaB.Bin006]|nr:MAG: 2-phospho-L-lactate guanylyltransferase [Syntrophorhabdus sp. PtaB.Bin006]